jgi:hypothetical protein
VKKIIFLVLVCVLLQSAPSYAHGVNMTTATITLRQHNHLSVRLATSLTAIFHQLDWQGKPPYLAHLLVNEEDLKAFHHQLVQLFEQGLVIQIDNNRLLNRQTRILNLEQLGEQLRNEAAEAILPGHSPHENYQGLVIFVDGFIPKQSARKQLKIDFPAELGPILTSYSEPQMQTLQAGETTTHYRLPLN